MIVYNPDDEPVDYRFAGVAKQLAANGKTELPDNEARFVAEAFGGFGVVILAPGPGQKKQLEEAEAKYLVGTRAWAVTTLVEWHESTKSQRELKIKLDEPPGVVTAKKWLVKHGFMEK